MPDTLTDGFHGRVAAALAQPTAANGDGFQARLTLATAAMAIGVTTSPDGFIERLIQTGLITNGPPGSPLLGFSAQNIDGTNNSSMIDGQAVGTWTNLGSIGATGNAVQATAGSKPAFRLIAVPGAIGNKSGIECVDAGRSMVTGTFTLIAQPYVIASVIRNTKAATQVYLSATSPLTELYSSTTTDHVNAGADTDTGMTASANQFHLRVHSVNGASSFLRVDGVQSSAFNPGAGGFGTAATLLRDIGSLGMIGFAEEYWVWSGAPGVGAPSVAAIESYFTGLYGAFPQ